MPSIDSPAGVGVVERVDRGEEPRERLARAGRGADQRVLAGQDRRPAAGLGLGRPVGKPTLKPDPDGRMKPLENPRIGNRSCLRTASSWPHHNLSHCATNVRLIAALLASAHATRPTAAVFADADRVRSARWAGAAAALGSTPTAAAPRTTSRQRHPRAAPRRPSCR